MHDPTQRLVKATEIFTKRAAIAEVTTKISQEVGESLSKQQKEFFLWVPGPLSLRLLLTS